MDVLFAEEELQWRTVSKSSAGGIERDTSFSEAEKMSRTASPPTSLPITEDSRPRPMTLASCILSRMLKTSAGIVFDTREV